MNRYKNDCWNRGHAYGQKRTTQIKGAVYQKSEYIYPALI